MPQKNRDAYNAYQREYQLKRYHARREEAFQLLGGCCTECGSKELLDIDHIEWRQKDLKLNKLWSISKVRFLAELKKCQILCYYCHTKKSKKDLSEIAFERE